ncbi:unnamed protein product [Phyllotreta striolata]|uniref:Uncharacterized protein n=1 Tax=Phyllotreta striolata TaxID=444603 RepID=A0A9N9XQZ4_PHYSR|nr:unnamed protein product [Phyllotreta striolata]
MKSQSSSWSRRTSKDISGMRRQRSLEWRERGYSSSEEEIPTRPVDSHVFASLLAQAQQEFSSSYRSDDTEDAATTDNPASPLPTPPPTLVSPRSPISLHRQASPFPLENTNSRRLHYQTPQDRLRGNNGEIIYAQSNKKNLSNSTLGRSGRSRHRVGVMTSSSSATSCNSCNDIVPNGDINYHDQNKSQRLSINNDVNEDSPPEPAPPEVPPRGPSLHAASLRRIAEYALQQKDSTGSNQESPFLGQGKSL